MFGHDRHTTRLEEEYNGFLRFVHANIIIFECFLSGWTRVKLLKEGMALQWENSRSGTCNRDGQEIPRLMQMYY